jgi:hypothetical protein
MYVDGFAIQMPEYPYLLHQLSIYFVFEPVIEINIISSDYGTVIAKN